MADVDDKETRSYSMSQIKSRSTKPELLVRKFLHAHGFRYRLPVKNLPGFFIIFKCVKEKNVKRIIRGLKKLNS